MDLMTEVVVNKKPNKLKNVNLTLYSSNEANVTSLPANLSTDINQNSVNDQINSQIINKNNKFHNKNHLLHFFSRRSSKGFLNLFLCLIFF